MRRAAALALVFLLGCSAKGREPAPQPSATSVASAEALSKRAARRAAEPLYGYARDGDELELRRLANREGAAALLEAVEDGSPERDTALLALPFADDSDVALRRLSELARNDSASRPRILPAIHGIASRPRGPHELLAPESVRRCGELLLSLAQDRTVARADRAMAVSAARALSEKGYVDAARIPADLDPR